MFRDGSGVTFNDRTGLAVPEDGAKRDGVYDSQVLTRQVGSRG